MRLTTWTLHLCRALGLLVIFCTLSSLLAPSAGNVIAAGALAAPTNAGERKVILMLAPAAADVINSAALGASKTGDRAARIRAVTGALQAQANATQPPALVRLEQMRAAGKLRQVRPFWITNAIAVTAPADQLAALAALPGVVGVVPDRPIVKVGGGALQTQALPASNLEQVHAPEVWAQGYTGQGVVVANLDTGVSLSASSLAGKYRGGTDSWYDVYGQSTTPYDKDGHGTGTMSIMVADTYGVAPGARWMAVKIFPDPGSTIQASDSDAIAGLQWALSPAGNPARAPNVVNNSWAEDAAANPSQPCPDSAPMHAALQALVAANILPVFAAGNFGPATSTAPIPSSYPEVIAVGAVDSQSTITPFSSLGPTNCRPAGSVFPDISAPGQDITFDSTSGGLAGGSGTSFSAPHVAGALAVLLSAYPGLSAAQQRRLLLSTATGLSVPRPNNTYGYGLLNLQAMYYRPLETHVTFMPVAAAR